MKEQIQETFGEAAAANRAVFARRSYEAPMVIKYGDAVAATLGADGAFPEDLAGYTHEESW